MFHLTINFPTRTSIIVITKPRPKSEELINYVRPLAPNFTNLSSLTSGHASTAKSVNLQEHFICSQIFTVSITTGPKPSHILNLSTIAHTRPIFVHHTSKPLTNARDHSTELLILKARNVSSYNFLKRLESNEHLIPATYYDAYNFSRYFIGPAIRNANL